VNSHTLEVVASLATGPAWILASIKLAIKAGYSPVASDRDRYTTRKEVIRKAEIVEQTFDRGEGRSALAWK
jgi:hypothetical protein